MTDLFQPVGEKPQWQMIYDGLTGLDIGDVITYERLADLLGVDDFRLHRGAWTKAANRWGSEHKRAFAPVRNVGYRVVNATEHELLARGHHRKSKRSLTRGRRMLETADRSLLSEEDRHRFDQLEQTISRHSDLIRRLDARQGRTEMALSQAAQQQTITEARISALEDVLRRHGIEPA
jgi:hypothetical protein